MNRLDLSKSIRRIEVRLRQLDQNRRNARMIGEFAIRQFEQRIIRRPARVEVDTAIDEVSLTAERRTREVAPTVNRWLLLSAAELIVKIEEMSNDELQVLLAAEKNGRRRITVIDAVERRLAE